MQKFFHWFMAVLIFGLLGAGFFMVDLELTPEKWEIYTMHKSIGFVVLMLIPIRLLWRFIYKPQRKYKHLSIYHQWLIKISVPVLYLMMITMVLSGFIMSDAGGYGIDFFGLWKIPFIFEKNTVLSGAAHFIHENAAIVFVVILITHVIAALYHHFIIKDDVLKSMLMKS